MTSYGHSLDNLVTSNGHISIVLVKEFSGNCRWNDHAVTEGRELILGINTVEQCLEQCKTLNNAKGCEWIVTIIGEKKCYGHKNWVNKGSGSAHSQAKCWVFSGSFALCINIVIDHIFLFSREPKG